MGSYKCMMVDFKLGIVYFEDYSDLGIMWNLLLINQLKKSFNLLISFGVLMDNICYYGFDVMSNSVIYWSYVEGFLIFNQIENGDVWIQFIFNGLDCYYFLLYSLQVLVLIIGQK